MALEMARIRIVGLKADMQRVILKLGAMGCVQIDDLSEATDTGVQPLELDREARQREQRLHELLAEIEGIQDSLECKPAKTVESAGEDYLEKAEAGIAEIHPQVEEITAQREKLASERDSLPRYESMLRSLIPEIPDSARDESNQTVGVIMKRQNRDVLALLRSQVADITDGQAETVSRKIDEDTQGMLLIYPSEYSAEIEDLLGERDISRLRLPDEFSHDSPDAIVRALRSRIMRIPGALRGLDDASQRLREAWCERLDRWAAQMQEDLQMYEMFSRLGQTEATFVLLGWTPEKELPELEKALRDEVGNRVFVEEMAIPDEIKEKAPVILENPQPVRPFESLVHLLASPTYGGLDPSWLMAVFLPIIFGMILGDAGYGAVLLILCLILLQRFQSGIVADLLKVLAYGSGWSIVFGILYGEFFGTLGEELGMHAIWFHRAGEEVTSLLILSLGVGAAHITLGLILGVWTAIQERSRSHLLERGGMLLGLAALFTLVGALAGYLPEGLTTPAIVGMIAGIGVLGSSMGWLGVLIGPIEFISLIGNLLSYLRIAAIGLASVYLAQVANDLGGALGNLLVGVLIAVLIHTLNIALGAFSPTIHSLRLHYVEFFRKFYEGGGRRFEPYKREVN